jgi:hypothetical protein
MANFTERLPRDQDEEGLFEFSQRTFIRRNVVDRVIREGFIFILLKRMAGYLRVFKTRYFQTRLGHPRLDLRDDGDFLYPKYRQIRNSTSQFDCIKNWS